MIKLFFLHIFTFSFLLSQNNSPSVAVLDFEAKGIPVYEAETLTERLRSEIQKTNAFRITDRKLLDKILSEQALQQSGCTTDECSAEIGQLLGAQYMISGSIGKLGSTYTVESKLVSVSTGAAERTESISFKGPIDELLIEMEILAWEISGLSPPQSLLAKRSKGGMTTAKSITVAVLDFEGRGISTLEAQTLTDRFSTEISKTGSAILVARNVVNEVMQEQGYTAAECSSEECAAEVGAMLGVKFMISGAIGKLGQTYTIDAKMFEVATGAAEKTINATYSGPVDGLITEIEILAWEILSMKPPGKLLSKRKGENANQLALSKNKTRFGAIARSMILPGWGQMYSDRSLMGWAFLGAEVALGALAYASYSTYQTHYDGFEQSYSQYSFSSDPLEKQTFKLDAQSNHQSMVDANDKMTLILYAAGGVYVINILHAAILGPKSETASKKSSIDFAFNPELQQPQLRFSIALD
tara:strand:- start:154 stop:1566 length:1413 start_codon:yes stop_codon:yes gene_type:complete